jgi:cytochrome b6-f complex iron-sulfur subunit
MMHLKKKESKNTSLEDNNQKRTRRRNFLTKLWFGLGFVALAEFIAVAYVFLRPGKPGAGREDPDAVVTAGAVDAFEPGSVTAFVRGRFYLVRLSDGGFLALSRKCTHLGCTVPWVAAENKFACPCHASAFDISGSVISPPAPRALDIYAVSIENDRVLVDTGQPIKRREFRKDQVAYA